MYKRYINSIIIIIIIVDLEFCGEYVVKRFFRFF